MKSFTGKTLRWEWRAGIVELTLDHPPVNEIGTALLAELEKFVATLGTLAPEMRHQELDLVLQRARNGDLSVSFMIHWFM